MNRDVVADILYEDDDIRVLWHNGGSDYLLITFGDMISLADGHRFFADLPVSKADIACIGIMAKRPHWYPRESLLRAAAILGPVLSRYDDRVTYGGSMGGYAALKFSGLLGATAVIALCPQWSLDPAECGGVDPGWQTYFTASMRGMGIRATDVSGAIFLFTDRYDAIDSFHARKIVEAAAPVTVINVPRVGHHVTTVFAGTSNLQTLVALARARDGNGLVAFVRAMRRVSLHRGHVLLEKALRRHPALSLRALEAIPDSQPKSLDWAAAFLFRVVCEFARQGRPDFAERYVRSFARRLVEPQGRAMAEAYIAALSKSETRVATFHGTLLYYSVEFDRCVHRSRNLDNNTFVPVRMRTSGDTAVLFADIGRTSFDLTLGHDGHLACRAVSGPPTVFHRHIARPGFFTFEAMGRFLSAEPEGWVVCNREMAQGWETFQLA